MYLIVSNQLKVSVSQHNLVHDPPHFPLVTKSGAAFLYISRTQPCTLHLISLLAPLCFFLLLAVGHPPSSYSF